MLYLCPRLALSAGPRTHIPLLPPVTWMSVDAIRSTDEDTYDRNLARQPAQVHTFGYRHVCV